MLHLVGDFYKPACEIKYKLIVHRLLSTRVEKNAQTCTESQAGRSERAFWPARGPFGTGPFGPGPLKKLAGPVTEFGPDILSVRSGL